MKEMKTTLPRADMKKTWYLVDAKDKITGRLAVRIAMILMGKHKPTYTAFFDTGDFVVVINAEKVKFTGKKMEQKTYAQFSGYPGGLKDIPLPVMLAKKPEEVIRLAVKRMLPKTTLGKQMIDKLKVYAGPNHPHSAQGPVPIEFKL